MDWSKLKVKIPEGGPKYMTKRTLVLVSRDYDYPYVIIMARYSIDGGQKHASGRV